ARRHHAHHHHHRYADQTLASVALLLHCHHHRHHHHHHHHHHHDHHHHRLRLRLRLQRKAAVMVMMVAGVMGGVVLVVRSRRQHIDRAVRLRSGRCSSHTSTRSVATPHSTHAHRHTCCTHQLTKTQNKHKKKRAPTHQKMPTHTSLH